MRMKLGLMYFACLGASRVLEIQIGFRDQGYTGRRTLSGQLLLPFDDR